MALRKLVSKKKRRFHFEGFDLDLTYITPRIIAMGFPSTGAEAMYRNPLSEVKKLLEKYHDGHCKVFNLCIERQLTGLPNIQQFPFADHNPCPLHMIPQFCKAVDEWLAADPRNVVAVHCKAGKVSGGAGRKPSVDQALWCCIPLNRASLHRLPAGPDWHDDFLLPGACWNMSRR